MAEQAEAAFIRTFASSLSNHPVTYADDYCQPPANSLKRVPILPVEVPPPPKRQAVESKSGKSAESLSITFKSLKPPQSFTLSVQPTDTIATIKSLIASQPNAPPASAQRLLLKGKALADGKLLKEYNVKNGDTVNLMAKPGQESAHSAAAPPKITTSQPKPEKIDLVTPSAGAPKGRHGRIPSVVLSPSPSSVSPASEQPQDINLTLDTSAIPTASLSSETTASTYHATVSKPEYWQRLYEFLKSEFQKDSDATLAFEDYLRASKGMLSASEIAKIRDHVGVMGMAGT